ncbi:hypothetical protein HMPREF0322_00394 [Desulfitobacterium hafniense DP7]|uniref:Cyanophage baseplate Pam3 plug gp18 domain-containing protein n=1 Tax=Desulfitobacterium hafniense DP7 TaxID=537010 RepID=G9XHG9_DESHA|nr:hypothetical protein [Desulfitobacterium hafniense]EHL08971.1 hypothetical protein HMPREF0322_00394 [Desulfitobacterium hafniense DP7]
MKIIPLTTDPDQNFSVTIPIDGKNRPFKLRVAYNRPGNVWLMSIYNGTTGALIIEGVPLVCGIDLFEQYRYLDLGSAIILNIGNTTMDNPDDTCLGVDFILVWGDTIG